MSEARAKRALLDEDPVAQAIRAWIQRNATAGQRGETAFSEGSIGYCLGLASFLRERGHLRPPRRRPAAG